jgi:glutamate/tyrosine decarboxylase-like PLP-dependent enzyme
MVVAAMILAFVGAVEQNLLDFNASSAHAIMDNRVVPFNSRIIGHLEKSLKKEN